MRKFITVLLTLLCTVSFLNIKADTYPYTDETEMDIVANYAYLVDIDSGQVLYEKNAYERMYPASMTKVMTAILAIETIGDLNQTVYMDSSYWNGLYEADASLAGFAVGEEPTVLDLLYGTLLPSGAEAVVALACVSYGSVDAFVDAMNAKAEELGMTSTHFTNPTGLHDENHYSSAYDIALLFEYALQNETFTTIADTASYTTAPLASHPDGLTLTSTFRPLINTDEEYAVNITGFLGGKTGYTNPAGRCLVSHAEYNGMHCVLVVGQSEGINHIYDSATIYNYFLNYYLPTEVINENTILSSYEVLDTLDTALLEVSTSETITMDLPMDANIYYETTLPDSLTAPITEGEVLGTITVYANDQIIYTSDLTAEKSYTYSSLAHALRLSTEFVTAHPVISIVLLCIFILLVVMLVARIRLAILRRRRRKLRAKRRKQKEKRG